MLRLLLAPLQRRSAVIRRLLLHPLPVRQLRAGTAWQWRRQLQQRLWLHPMLPHVSDTALRDSAYSAALCHCCMLLVLVPCTTPGKQ